MPLHDHFRPPVDKITSGESFLSFWTGMLGKNLLFQLPQRYRLGLRVRWGGSFEIDIPYYEEDDERFSLTEHKPPPPTLSAITNFPTGDTCEVKFYDDKYGRRLVAAIEIISPSNKDRAEHRQAFVSKCAALLQEQVSVILLDVVTTRSANLYADLLALMGQSDPFLTPEPPALYAVACRCAPKEQEKRWDFESWTHRLAIGQPLPTVPLWIADNLALPLDLESSYQEACRVFRID